MINKPKKKKQLLVKLKAPYFIHKDVQGTNLTFFIADYALPWKEISDAPLCDAAITKINKVKKAFPEAHIEFNFQRENPAFLFKVVGILIPMLSGLLPVKSDILTPNKDTT